MTVRAPVVDAPTRPDMRTARTLFPATAHAAYFNTAVVGLASRALTAAYHAYVDEWADVRPRLRPRRGRRRSARGLRSRRLIGADRADVALIASVSAAAGLVAAQFGAGRPGQNVVIGEREYSSNHFPWRQLAHKGYEVRQVPFRNGGLEPDDIARARRRRHGARRVQRRADRDRPSLRHPGDQRDRPGRRRDRVRRRLADSSARFPSPTSLDAIDVLATADHKFLLNAGRGLGYCYLSPAVRERFTPVNAGWKAGRVPVESFFGPTMDLSPTASRFDNSISWLAAIGNEAALAVFETFGADAVYARNVELAERSARARRRVSGGRPSTCRP